MNKKEIKKLVKNNWESIPKNNMVLHTGKGGAILYYEMLIGKELTQEQKDSLLDGIYELHNAFITYKGKY